MKSPVEVIPSPWFSKRIKRLQKRYPHVAQDTRPLIEQLQHGETPGDHIQAKDYTVYKARVPKRDAQRGKSRRLPGRLLYPNANSYYFADHLHKI